MYKVHCTHMCRVVFPIMQLYAYWRLLFIQPFYILYLCHLFTCYTHIDMLLYMCHTWYSIMHINNSYMCSWWRYIHSVMIQVDCFMGCALGGIKKPPVSMKISSQALPILYALQIPKHKVYLWEIMGSAASRAILSSKKYKGFSKFIKGNFFWPTLNFYILK